MTRIGYEARVCGTLYSVNAQLGYHEWHVTMKRDGEVIKRFRDPAAVDQIRSVPLNYMYVHGVFPE